LKKLQILWLLTLFFSCGSTSENENLIFEFDDTAEIKYKLPKGGIENILFIDTRLELSPPLFSCYNYIMNRVEVYDAETNFFLYDVQFKEFGPDVIRPIKFQLFREYVVVIDDLKNLAIINNQGKVIRKLNGRAMRMDESPDSFTYRLQASPAFGLSSHVDHNNHKLYAHLSRWDVATSSDAFYTENKNIVLEIDLNTLEVYTLPINYPEEILKYKNLIKENLTWAYPYILFSNQKLIYNFPFNNKVYLYDLKQGQTKTYSLTSEYTDQEVPEISPTMSKKEIGIWERNQLRFNQIVYDPFRNIYLRTHSYFNETAKKRIYFLMAFDEQFNKLAEIRLPEGCSSLYYPSEEGILIKYRHPENEDYIFFKKLSVK